MAAAVLPDVFKEDSDSDGTFYGFSDTELKNLSIKDEDEDLEEELSPQKQKSTSKPSAGARTFRLRVALRSAPSTLQSTDEDGDEGEVEERTKRGGNMKKKKKKEATGRRVKFEEEEKEAALLKSEEATNDSGGEETDSFLAKREQNIKANKAMLAQLMADLQKMPGVASILQKQAGKQKTREKSSRPPRSAGAESRTDPERASRRQTRSMGATREPSAPKEEQLELSLEEELLEVRRAPRRRGAPRPSQAKPHVVRPPDDITEDELQLIAENMTDKVYDRATGSTCHQCRQKTTDTKTCCRDDGCRGIQGQFCGPCLRNRYGEDVRKALLDPGWRCPPCRGICNCSFCRQREGRCPTGILFPLAQYHGFSDVHSYLTSLRSKLTCDDDDVAT